MIAFLLILLALVGVPLFAVIGLGAILGYIDVELDPVLVAMEFQRIGDLPVLVALPMFCLAGVLVAESGTPRRLVDLTRASLGWLPGGLAILGLVMFSLMTAFTGASGITVIALGSLMLPALIQAGYPRRFALGLVTTGSSLGVLFAPSLPLILYAVVAQQVAPGQGIGVNDLFLAGLLPGLLMIVVLAAWAIWQRRHTQDGSGEAAEPAPPLWPSLRAMAWELPLPFVVLGGIYSGWLLVAEAAVVTAVWVVVSLVLIRREIPIKRLPALISESMMLVGAILLILGMSLASTNVMIDAQVPQRLLAWVTPLIDSKLVFLLLINLVLLVAGMVLDIFAALVILAPLIIPIALAFGVDPVHLGIVFLANLQIGYCTPPVGINLFLASHRFGDDILRVYRSTLPFLGLLLVALLIITWFPGLSLWLTGRG
ncbi:TRAP transporter large permease [Wenzhouxiangella marina]|uniref:TRAP transporter large permease protein n=1 Tax=Wenzhouxiangella marina TaxID=1579979 RepID=A0A0K0XWC5_9GAMM|nr:TRAP transporter large permease subunit [Wenzhouxiangella marina]AKS41932.1 TRAP dicarboxylate transporter-DctM subunit [Wenzhouxiangella marina]MBB6086301.1 tripartite ATP-independent transporter DctM subunit [Wenzhouxiangella marina]